jgi:hypothetical protein
MRVDHGGNQPANATSSESCHGQGLDHEVLSMGRGPMALPMCSTLPTCPAGSLHMTSRLTTMDPSQGMTNYSLFVRISSNGGTLVITETEARLLANEFLDAVVRPDYNEPVDITSVVEYDQAWAIGYNTRRFIDGTLSASLLGNGPVVVPKDGSDPYLASSARPVADQLTDRSQ